ncbi:hypothetical protein PFISCL1PPCAC_14277 [Pristionchus fissidentatus]|uniref:G protein-coupled receptor n=1 Tax=Pristionchus fissidentatus TaxID=1538716 RepID=A0AAV5VY32_9BILA|nr:hypothetical protein PFISCL1PPCAC_14277 [Pristionchus fissidentatus]
MFQVRTTLFRPFVLMSLMWSLTPSISLLQLTALSRSYWKTWRRIVLSFTFTIICIAVVLYILPLIMPSRALALIMEKSMRELFEMDQDQFLQTYGNSITYASINDGKSTYKFMLLFAVIPYCASYTIIVASTYQSILPLIILSFPLVIAVYGTIADSDLGLATLPLTGFVWIVPIVQVPENNFN